MGLVARSTGPEPRFVSRDALDLFESFQSTTLRSSGMSVARYRYDKAPGGITEPNAPEASFMAVLPLRRLPPHHVFRAGRPVKMADHPPSTISIFDFREAWTAELLPLDTFNVFVPESALRDLTDSIGAPRIKHLTTGADFVVPDATMFSLANSMLPALSAAGKPSSLFLEHVLSAMRVHLATAYGGVDLSRVRPVGGLAPWQERRAKEIMEEMLSRDLSMAELAGACGLSVSHFQRAFRNSTGETPHQWRMKRRVERAKTLLEGRRFGLPEIALICGFADQSHLGRVFVRTVGRSPGAYRAAL